MKKLFVLSAVYDGRDWQFTLIELIRHRRKVRVRKRSYLSSLESLKKYRKEPFVLILGGTGVISRIFDAADTACERISGNSEQFLSYSEYTTSDGSVSKPEEASNIKITFVRREQFDDLVRKLTPSKLPVVSIRLDPGNDFLKESLEAGNDFFGSSPILSELAHPTAETNLRVSLCTNKILLPVLCGVLIVLLSSFFIGRDLRQKIQLQQSVLNRLDKEAASDADLKKQQTRLFAMLLPEPAYRYSIIADRIASVVPPDIILTELTVNPLTKRIQENKPLQSQIGKIRITGNCNRSAPIAQFSGELKTLEFVKDIKMIALDKSRSGNYLFEIEVYL